MLGGGGGRWGGGGGGEVEWSFWVGVWVGEQAYECMFVCAQP